ncbi:MAG: hypothetical protein U0797_09425 [Gemmataceae bacterium]
MSLKSASALWNADGRFSGLIMNCISARTDRASAPPFWYIVFFFNSHQAAASSTRSSCRSRSRRVSAG